MDSTTIGVILNVVLGLATFLLKNAYADLKEDNKSLWEEVRYIRDKYYKREDFSEFKSELWSRLDRIEDDLKRQIQEQAK